MSHRLVIIFVVKVEDVCSRRALGEGTELDTVFWRPYLPFSIGFYEVFSYSNRCEIYTSYWFWIEVCPNLAFSKIDITMATINRKRQNQ